MKVASTCRHFFVACLQTSSLFCAVLLCGPLTDRAIGDNAQGPVCGFGRDLGIYSRKIDKRDTVISPVR